MKIYKAYIFDFDGVIKESVFVKSAAFVELYAEEGAAFQKRVEDWHLANGGVSRYVKLKLWNEWLGRSTSDATISELAARFGMIVREKVVASDFVDGALEAVEFAQINGSAFIATGTPDEEISHILSELNLLNRFSEIHGSSRPKTSIVEDILARHDFQSQDVLFIGDAMTDYDAAMEFNLDFYLRETAYNSIQFEGKPGITYRSPSLNRVVV